MGCAIPQKIAVRRPLSGQSACKGMREKITARRSEMYHERGLQICMEIFRFLFSSYGRGSLANFAECISTSAPALLCRHVIQTVPRHRPLRPPDLSCPRGKPRINTIHQKIRNKSKRPHSNRTGERQHPDPFGHVVDSRLACVATLIRKPYLEPPSCRFQQQT